MWWAGFQKLNRSFFIVVGIQTGLDRNFCFSSGTSFNTGDPEGFAHHPALFYFPKGRRKNEKNKKGRNRG